MTRPVAVHEFPVSRRWNAQWIWTPRPGRTENVFQYFRREVALDAVPETATLFIAADTRYQLFVNGVFVARGAPQSQPYFQYYDERDLTPHLRAGENCIALLVNHLGTLPMTRPGLLAELVDGSGATILATGDGGWRTAEATAWRGGTFRFHMNQATPFQEVFDARAYADGWNEVGFDDAGWETPSAISGRIGPSLPPQGGPWSRLLPRDIPDMTDDPVAPVQVAYVEECLDIKNRCRSEDLSVSLSASGGPVTHSTLENVENLCAGGAAVVQCSTLHLEGYHDGIHDPCIILDFGKALPAYIELELDGPAGGMVDIGYVERLLDGRFNNAIECQFAERYMMRDGPQTYRPYTWKSFRYVKLRFRRCFEPVTVRAVRARVTTFPYEERGRFESGDETLDAVFDISRETLRLCSNEFLMDTPWREQAQWLGDVAAVTVPGVYACFGDVALVSKFIRQSAANQLPSGMLANVSNSVPSGMGSCIPDYSLWWVMGLWAHYHFTGETRWIDTYYPEAMRVMHAHYDRVNEFGLVENMPYWAFIDWAHTDRRGECSAYNAIFAGALDAFASMADFKGDAHARDRARLVRETMGRHFRERLFDDERGVFADARIGDALSERASEHASTAPILWNLCDDATADAVINRIYEEKSVVPTAETQPFFTTVVLRALARRGRFDLALDVIRERWGERMVARGMTSCLEEWYENGSRRNGDFDGFFRSHSHAWSACPAEFLVHHLTGFSIGEPGCAKASFAPVVTPFDYDAVVPTPQGDIHVTCMNGDVSVDAPESVTVTDMTPRPLRP